MRKDLEGQSEELREGQHEGSSVLQRGIEPATIRTTRLTFKFCIFCRRALHRRMHFTRSLSMNRISRCIEIKYTIYMILKSRINK